MSITILNTEVRQDQAGRYSLNDLHRAAGGDSRHQPAFWLRNGQTQSLIDEMRASANSQTPVVTVNDGRNNGTYVARELVYAYAMWISSSFHLRVIRTFDAATRTPASTLPQTFAEALRLAADQAEELERARPAVAFVGRYVDAPTGAMGFRQVAKLLGAKEPELRAWLVCEHIMYRLDGVLTPYAQHIEAGRFEIRAGVASNEHAYNRALFTPKGFHWVSERWAARKVAVPA